MVPSPLRGVASRRTRNPCTPARVPGSRVLCCAQPRNDGWDGVPGEWSAVAGPIVGPQEVGAELIKARTADLAHHQIDLVDKDIDRLLDPGEPAGGGTVEGRPAEEAEIGAE